MAGIQFGRFLSFSLTKHTWELYVTSEVGRKMTLIGHQISYVIYYQLQGHLTIIFNVLFSFSISERRTLRSFGMNVGPEIGMNPRQLRGLPYLEY